MHDRWMREGKEEVVGARRREEEEGGRRVFHGEGEEFLVWMMIDRRGLE